VVEVPRLKPGATSVWAQYTIVSEDRDGLAKACRDAGVPTAIHYSASLNRLPPYRQAPTPPGGLPQAEWLSERVISLPMHPYLTEAQQDLVVRAVRDAVSSPKANRAHAAE
jgi:dTDP-4-amino-4,6-dideoxygalactose transaminase